MVKARNLKPGDIFTQRALLQVTSTTKRPGYVTVAPVESLTSEYHIQHSVFDSWNKRAEGYEAAKDTFTPGIWHASLVENTVKVTPTELANKLKNMAGVACKLEFLKKPDLGKNIAALVALAAGRFESIDDHKEAVESGVGVTTGRRSAKKINEDIAAGLHAFADTLQTENGAKLRNLVLDAITTGERRPMIVLYQGHDEATGHLKVTDVEKLAETGNWRASNRIVNPSTVQYVVWKGTRYELKHD